MELQKPIRGIFFDLGWTLITPTSGDWMFSELALRYFPREARTAYPEQYRAARISANEALIQDHRMSTTDEEYEKFHEFYLRIARAMPELGVTEADVKKITEDKVCNMENYGVFPDSVPTLEALCGKYRLGAISDTWPSIVQVLEHFDILKYFDCETYSYQLGLYKPEAALYQDALEKMALPAGETVFVDDGVSNLLGAQAVGIQPVLIRARPNPDSDDGIVSIDRISELVKVLEEQ